MPDQEAIQQTISPSAIVKPEISSELRKFQANVLRLANDLVIEDAESNDGALTLRKMIDTNYRIIEEIHDKACDRLYKAWKGATGDRTADLAPFEQADKILEKKRIEWDDKVEKARLEEQIRLEQIAIAERHETAVAEASVLEAQGEHEAAEEVVQQAISAPPPSVYVAPPPKSKGAVKVPRYRFEIDEPKLPREYMIPDDSSIRTIVNKLGMRTNIPGVKVFVVKTENIRQ